MVTAVLRSGSQPNGLNYLAMNTSNNNTTSISTSGTSASASTSAFVSASASTVESDKQTQHHQQMAPTPTRKRASSFIRKKPPLERGLSAQSALRVNKNAYVSDAPAPEVIVTKPSPEQQKHPHVHALSLRPDNATLVHVLVHRESEEYKEDDECSLSSPGQGSANGSGHDKPKPPQIRINTGSMESGMDACLMPTVQIMVDSPKEPPRGDFSAAYTPTVDVDAPIDVNVQGDTSQVFYEYNPESNVDNSNDIQPMDAKLPDTDDKQR
ncbi:uncharacterized protein Dmoj_GI19866, isoform D [Drosophila mojavensis]|uniref:Uncharacterized protein, isoform D n=2 Tax=Drosophila mojavensis TaxID=7230 RepID=B4KR69_DROMO|nr:uncharacterized protein Dmoj_GI19866, isoform D [Drosophila mojavensis]